MRGARHESERRVADRDEHVVQVGRSADALLRVVESAEAARVALDRRFGASELVERAHREDARVLLRVVGEGHGDLHDAIASRRAR